MTTLRQAAQRLLYKAQEGASFTCSEPPKPVGFWVLYPGAAAQTKFAIYKRPTDEQIKNTEALLGWGWEES